MEIVFFKTVYNTHIYMHGAVDDIKTISYYNINVVFSPFVWRPWGGGGGKMDWFCGGIIHMKTTSSMQK